MNKGVIFIILFVLGISSAYSQNSLLDRKVSGKFKNASVQTIFEHISHQTNCYFTYDPEIISLKKKYSVSYNNVTIQNILNDLFKSDNLQFEIIKDHIVIYKKRQADYIHQKKLIQEDKYLKISAKIIDKKTKKTIPFVSIGIKNSTIGIVANENGEFELKIPKQYIDSSLFILHIGYNNYFRPVKDFNNNEIIQLDPTFISIQEVIITNKDPLVIIESAISAIKDNYAQIPSNLYAFYREGVTKKKNVISFSEAVIQIQKPPYKSSVINDKVKILKSRKIINSKLLDTVFIKLKDGLYSGLMLDLIRNPISFFDRESLNSYNFILSDIVTYDNKLTNVIEFNQKDAVNNNLYRGKLFIEAKSFVLIAAEFEVNFKNINQSNTFVVRKNRKFKVKPLSAKYMVKYKKTGKVYMLNHVRADLQFRVKVKKETFSSKYDTFFETAVIETDFNNISKFDKNETARRNMIFIDNNFTYDATFWGNNNFIKPEQSIKDAINQIHAKLDYKH